jgi:hypothetical protein
MCVCVRCVCGVSSTRSMPCSRIEEWLCEYMHDRIEKWVQSSGSRSQHHSRNVREAKRRQKSIPASSGFHTCMQGLQHKRTRPSRDRKYTGAPCSPSQEHNPSAAVYIMFAREAFLALRDSKRSPPVELTIVHVIFTSGDCISCACCRRCCLNDPSVS